MRVVRVQRDGDFNRVQEIDREGIKKLWNDPILRYSDALDGVFHARVLVCEGDADCRFYAAVMDAIWGGLPDESLPDVMFTHCGGKHRMPVIINALRALDVPASVIVDFDVLREEGPLSSIVAALGGDWALLKRDWVEIRNAIDSKRPELRTSEVKAEINATLDTVQELQFPQKVADDIGRILRRSSAWATAKEAGKAYVPAGQPRQTYDRLILSLRQIGLHVVEVGELEFFDRSVGRHGPAWVNQAVEKNLVSDPIFAEARAFVSCVLSDCRVN